MFGITLIFALAVMGGIIAFIGDKLGYKFGKQRLSIFGLRPRDTSTLMAIASGVIVAALTLGSLSVVSSDVRTALFGMDALKAQLESMGKDVDSKNLELAELQKQFEASSGELREANLERDKTNDQLASLQVAQREAYAQLDYYQKESGQLKALRDNLQVEVATLEEETRALEQGVINLREGQVVFRAGQLIYAGVLRAGENQQDTLKMLNDFLSFANNNVLEVLGIEDKTTQVIFVTPQNFAATVDFLLNNRGQVAVRLQSAGNILVGEPVMTEFSLYPNQRIYAEKQEIFSETVPANVDRRAAQAILISFLSRLNNKAVNDGLLPDPISGNVGDMDLPYMMEVMEKIRSTQGAFAMTAVASQDIYTLGPLRVNIVIKERL